LYISALYITYNDLLFFLPFLVEKVPWSQSEINKLIVGYNINGPNWIEIIKDLPGKSSLQARNKFYSIQKRNKRIKDQMSIDRLLIGKYGRILIRND